MTLSIVNYIVQFKDDPGVWFDGSPPMQYKFTVAVREHYADGGFETRVVPALTVSWLDHEKQRLAAELEEPHLCYFDGPFACDHPDCVREAQKQQQAEIDAENAWLRAAEAPTPDDYAFEAWEAQRLSPAEYDRYYGDFSADPQAHLQGQGARAYFDEETRRCVFDV